MNLMHRLVELFVLSVIVLVLDLGFLISMRGYFNTQIRKIQGTDMKMDYVAAALCYMVIIGCLFRFIIQTDANILEAALLGWSVYLIYELTNKGLFTNWSWTTVMIDGIWGGILFSASTYVYRQIMG
jgi:uncharacterized membrane protein